MHFSSILLIPFFFFLLPSPSSFQSPSSSPSSPSSFSSFSSSPSYSSSSSSSSPSSSPSSSSSSSSRSSLSSSSSFPSSSSSSPSSSSSRSSPLSPLSSSPSSSSSSSSPSSPSSSSTSAASPTRANVEACLQRVVLRLRALNGPFFTQQQGIHIALNSMEMYVREKMQLEQIADYFYYNYNSLGLSPDQCQKLADIYASVVEIMGNSANATDSLFYHGVGAAIGQIRGDKEEADAMIGRMEAEGADLAAIELALCRFSLPRITPERKRQIVGAIAALIPTDKRLAIRDQLRKVVWLD